MKKIIFGFVLAACLFGALNYHFILASGRLVVERKSRIGFSETFVDARDWSIVDHIQHPRIAAILAERGIERLVGADKSVVEEGKEAIEGAAEKIGRR